VYCKKSEVLGLQPLPLLYPIYTIEQTSSKRRASVFKIHVLIARRLLNEL